MRFFLRNSRVALAISVVIVFVASLGGIAAAVQVGSGTIGGFEVDGNFAVNGGSGSLDWTNVSPVIVNDDTADSGFTEGSKELKPSSWDCGTGGATPDKGNILRSYVGTRVDGTGSFVFLGFVAQNISGQGDVHLNFEFSQHGTAEDPGSFTPGDCSIPRAAGDLLVSFDYAGGNTDPVVNLFKWQPAAHPDGNHDGDWVDQNLSAAAAKAAVNSDTVSDPVNPTDGSIGAGRFGEAAIDLSLALPPVAGSHCASFGFMNVRSRSSGESVTSAIQDKLPTTGVDLSTCGSIKIHKTDDHVPPQALAGATFGLFDNSSASGTPLQTKVTGANGTATFGGLDPGDYWVKEISAPSGYSPDPDIVKVTVGVLENVDVTAPFVDPRDVGSVRIYKDLRDDHGTLVTPNPMSAVNGASFVLYKDANTNDSYDSGEAVKLWPQQTADATCTITNSLGYCDIPASGFAIPTGTYRVHETAAPADTGSGSDVGPVVVVKNTRVDVHYTNTLSPLNITIHKSGSSSVAHLGDTIHYTFAVSTTGPKLHAITVAEVGTDRCDGAITGPVKTGGDQDAFLESGETWTYGCDHVVQAGDPDPLPNTAQVTGTDTFGRTVTDDDSFSVDILKPVITLDKTVEGADHKPIGDALVVRSGTLVHYVVVIHNAGDTALTLSSLNDSLHGALTGAQCTPNPAGGLAVGASITCSYTANPTDDAHNVASVTGVDVLGGAGGTVTASDETFVDVIHPALTVVKTATSTLQPGVNDVTVAHVGDPVVYHFAVHNTGDVTLTNISVDDVPLGHIGTIASLAPGATTTLTLAIPAPASDLHNTVTACGDPGVGENVCGNDDHTLDIIHPGITVVKTATSTLQPGVDDVTQAHPGDPVVYHFAVHNSGDVPLTNVTVNDSVFGLIPGSIANLAVGATDTSLSKTIAAPASDLFNTATACGFDPLATQKCATDDHLLDIINPGLDVTKSANKASAHVGDTVTYTFSVHNTGDVALTNVSVDDDVFGHIGTIDSLAAGATEELTKTVEITAGMLNEAGNAVDNTVTACGTDPVAAQKCDTDFHHLPVLHPAITIDKKVEGGDHKPVSDALLAHQGDTLGYTVVIHNTGDTPLEITALSDTLRSGVDGTCGKGIGDTLGVDESTTCTYTMTAGADDAHNVVSVSGVDAAGGPNGTTSASDETFVDVIHPAISITKVADPKTVEPGQATTYTYVVKNTGDVTLTDVAVTDDILGAIGNVPSLAPGASTTFTKTVTIAADSPRTNVATATGVDPLQLKVSATATESISIVLPLPPTQRPRPRVTVTPPRTLPHTGFNLILWLAIGVDLVAAGMAMMNVRRRWRGA